MADNSMTGAYQLNLPKDLVLEAKRQPKQIKEQLRVEGVAYLVALAHFRAVGRERLSRQDADLNAANAAARRARRRSAEY